MLLASNWPPSVTASNSNCRLNPMAIPMMICCRVTNMPVGGKHRDVGRRRNQGRNDHCHGARQDDPDPRRNELRTEGRCDHEAGAHAHERPQQLREPSLELSCGE